MMLRPLDMHMGMKDLGGGRARHHPRIVCGFLGFGTVGLMDLDESEKEAAGTGGGYPSIPPAMVYARQWVLALR